MANEIRDAFNTVYADGPTGNPDEPDKYQVREIVGGTIQDQVDEAKALAQGAAEGYVIGTTWAALAGIVGTRAGQPGRVPTSDSGTHTDPVVGGTVSNSGEYAWSVSPAGWRRVGDVIDPSVLAPKNSPVFTGTPVAPTPSATDRSTKIATTENVKTSVETVAIDLPFVAQRAHSFPDAAGVPLAGILDDGRVVGYRRSGGLLVCFGDSITAFSDYPDRIASRLGFKSAVNVGFGGERMGQHPDANHDKFSMYQLAAAILANDFSAQTTAAATLTDHQAALDRLIAIDWNAVSTVTIGYGTNDFGGDVPIGTASDATGATFRGAIKLSIERLLTAYPHLELVMVTPMWRQRQAAGDNKDATNFPNGLGDYLVEYVDAELDQAALAQIPALDLYRNCGINLQTYTVYLDDGLHARTEPGNELLAKRIAAFLETISC
ncbi:SGNH/GDSL hydrolase family protein [Sinorhizobium meliloti]|uniref:SGNH/GDSL hydrolase family protein n=1 Tax=Rhizobium meliloti TaxID=382 RepID=UPI000FD74F3C|nr:SGNH/GDSL hydrolase family protein [Sinorhizobium meliloti]RVP32276.1 SGNH/GDSL hydrolase family protein [Sinorhizobium meliloti]